LGQDASHQIAASYGRDIRCNRNSDSDCSGGSQAQHRRRPATGGFAFPDLFNQAFSGQRINDRGNCRPLQITLARNLGARNWLALAHKVQHNLTIDIANRTRARSLNFPKIDASQFWSDRLPWKE